MKKVFNLMLLVAATAAIFTSCKKDDPVPTDPVITKEYTVTFNSQGGSTVQAITVQEGAKITKPTDPTKAYYTFEGWYKEVAATTVWNFDTDVVTADITLYAKWEEVVVENPYPAGNYSYENQTATTKNLTGAGTYYVLEDGSYVINVFDAAQTTIARLVVLPNGNLVGTYPISFSGRLGTAKASPGSEEVGYVSPPFLAGYSSSGLSTPIYFLVSGTVTITSNTISVNALSYYGSTITITASLSEYVEPEPDAYQWETTTVSTQNLTGSGRYLDYAATDGYYYIVISDGSSFDNVLVVFSNGTGMNGTYTFADTYVPGTALASPGGNDETDYPSYLMLYSGTTWIASYYLMTGTVTINGTNVTVHATSYYGSTINVSCTSLVEVQGSGAPKAKSVKRMVSKKLLFDKNAKSFPFVK